MKQIILSGLLLVLSMSAFSQGALISPGAGTPDASAILELRDSTRGLLVPRMNTTQRNAIVNPAVGLTIYNTTTACFEGYLPTGWKPMVCNCTQAPATPGIISGSATVCPNQTNLTYSISPVNGASGYTWTVPNGSTIISGQGTTSIVVNSGTNSGSVSVTASNSCGTSAAATLSVTVQAPNANFSFLPANPGIGSQVTFTPVQSGTSYAWSFPSGSPATSTNQNPVITWSNAGTYTVTLILTANGGCADTVSQTITVSTCLPFQNIPTDFTYTGSMQTWTVPPGVCSITIECWGAQGSNGVGGNSAAGGLGGYAAGTLTVIPGTTYNIYVGGQTGWNGGGAGGTNSGGGAGGSGGGASDVRAGGTALNNRIIIAGGGGGGGGHGTYSGGICSGAGGVGGGGGGFGGGGGVCNGTNGSISQGGNGGNIGGSCVGGNGGGGGGNGGGGGGGGNGGSPGTGGVGANGNNGAIGSAGGYGGTLGNGGAGNASYSSNYGNSGGGGGGWYGGGGGGCWGHAGGGGGGSSYTTGVTNGSTQNGIRSGNGLIRITY